VLNIGMEQNAFSGSRSLKARLTVRCSSKNNIYLYTCIESSATPWNRIYLLGRVDCCAIYDELAFLLFTD
jgi:hypothetical protein